MKMVSQCEMDGRTQGDGDRQDATFCVCFLKGHTARPEGRGSRGGRLCESEAVVLSRFHVFTLDVL